MFSLAHSFVNVSVSKIGFVDADLLFHTAGLDDGTSLVDLAALTLDVVPLRRSVA